MKVLTIPYSEDVLITTSLSAQVFEQSARFWLVVKLFELSRLLLGKTAEL
jgi:hypothetical protein